MSRAGRARVAASAAAAVVVMVVLAAAGPAHAEPEGPASPPPPGPVIPARPQRPGGPASPPPGPVIPARPQRPDAIAILPMTAGEPRLELYSRPIAAVVARGLGRATGAAVEVVAGRAPSTVAWVIDGRIVARGGGAILLEARLRDPVRGTAAGTVTTRARPLRQVDRLATELTAALAALHASAEPARQRALSRGAPRASEAPVAVAPVAAADPVAAATPATAPVASPSSATSPAPDPRPRLLVASAGRVLDGVVDLAGPAAGAGGRAAARLGFAAAFASSTAFDRAPAEALSRAGAVAGLRLEVLALDFSWRGVLSARGAVRVVAVDRAGRVVLDHVARTDTVVGSRGDRHAALVHLVLDQALDVVGPHLRRALAR